MRRGYLALFLLALIWGASFLFIKLAVRDMSPATLVFSRSLAGVLTLGVVFAARRQTPFPAGTRTRLLPYLVMAITGSLLPWFGFGFGELSISSALASILNATTPLWTALFAFWVTPAERPSGLNYVGVAIGFLGTGIVIAPGLVGQPLRATTVGTLAVAGALLLAVGFAGGWVGAAHVARPTVAYTGGPRALPGARGRSSCRRAAGVARLPRT